MIGNTLIFRKRYSLKQKKSLFLFFRHHIQPAGYMVDIGGCKEEWQPREDFWGYASTYISKNGGEGVQIAIIDVSFKKNDPNFPSYFCETRTFYGEDNGHGSKVGDVVNEIAPEADLVGVSVGYAETYYYRMAMKIYMIF